VYVPPSSWQKKVKPPSVSEKVKMAFVSFVGFAGIEVMAGAGGGAGLTVQVKVAAPL
jgi:hypothetical protein